MQMLDGWQLRTRRRALGASSPRRRVIDALLPPLHPETPRSSMQLWKQKNLTTETFSRLLISDDDEDSWPFNQRRFEAEATGWTCSILSSCERLQSRNWFDAPEERDDATPRTSYQSTHSEPLVRVINSKTIAQNRG